MAKVVQGARARRSRVSSEEESTTDQDPIEALVTQLLLHVGEIPLRNGLQNTPKRFAKAMRFMTQGYQQDIDHLLNGALFPIEYDEMVIVKDIDFFSMCEHHLLPFMGKAHVGYLPNGKVVGLSKLARVIDEISRRPQVQERMTHQIADLMDSELQAKGVIVVLEAEHTCMTVRGVKKPGAMTITSAVRGLFKTNPASRAEVLSLIQGR